MANSKFCIHCGTQLPKEAQFCFNCGKEQSLVFSDNSTPTATADAVQPKETAAPEAEPVASVAQSNQPIAPYIPAYIKKKMNKSSKSAGEVNKNIFLYGKAIATMVIAFIMLIMVFLPTIKYEYSISSYEVDVKLSTIDQLSFTFSSFESLDDGGLEYTDEYDEMLELRDELIDEIEDSEITDEGEEIIAKIAKIAMHLELMYEKTNLGISFYIASLLSVLYILSAIAFFVFALLNLLHVLGVLKISVAMGDVATLSALVPALALALYISMYFCYGFASNARIGGSCIVVFILALLMPVINYLAAFFAKEKTVKLSYTRIASFAVSFLLVIMLFTPVMTSSVEAVFDGRTTEKEAKLSMDASYFETLNIDDDAVDYYKKFAKEGTKEAKQDILNGSFGDFEDLPYSAVSRETLDAVLVNTELLHILGATRGLSSYGFSFSLISTAYIMVGIAACSIMWLNLSYYSGGKYSRAAVNVCKILAVLFMIAAVALLITYLVFINAYISIYELSGYSVGISAGLVFTILFVIAQACLPAKRFDLDGTNGFSFKRKNKYAYEWAMAADRAENAYADAMQNGVIEKPFQ